jgi:hypothetical protein
MVFPQSSAGLSMDLPAMPEDDKTVLATAGEKIVCAVGAGSLN